MSSSIPGLTFRTDEAGGLGAIGVVRIWDDLTAMLIIEDWGMDGVGNDALTAEGKQRLAAQLSQWPEDHAGDPHLAGDGKLVEPIGPQGAKADDPQGRLFPNHLRRLPEVRGRRGRHVSICKADIGPAQKFHDRLPGRLAEEETMELGRYPEVGGAFAGEVVLECDARP